MLITKGNTIMKSLEIMTIKELTAYYNELTGKSIKKFSQKSIAMQRIIAILPKVPTTPKTTKKKGRILDVYECLKGNDWTIASLMKHFDTNYKNITGDLHRIRRDLLAEGEELLSRTEDRQKIFRIFMSN